MGHLDFIFIAVGILAADDSDSDGDIPWVKILPFAIVVSLWVIGAIAKAVSKKTASPRPAPVEWQGRPDVWPVANRPIPGLPPRVRDPRLQSVAAPRTPPPPPLPAAVQRPVNTPPRSSQPRRSTATTAAEVRRWLSPRELKAKYPMTEIFDPPASMRDD